MRERERFEPRSKTDGEGLKLMSKKLNTFAIELAEQLSEIIELSSC